MIRNVRVAARHTPIGLIGAATKTSADRKQGMSNA
jgi:hypothetical protein